jgi:hypothetical protein
MPAPHDGGNGERDRLGRLTRRDEPPPDPRLTGGKKRRPMYFKHFKVDELLPDEHKPAYEKLMRDPRTTVPMLQDFLRKLGIVVSRNAVASHRIHAHFEVKRVQEMSLMAKAFCELTREQGASTVAEASHAKFEMKLMEFLFKQHDAPVLSAEQLERMGKVTQRAVQTRVEVEAMHEDAERREREAERAAEEANTPQKSQRQRTLDVVRRMDEIMGITRPDGYYEDQPGDEGAQPEPADS